MFIFDSSIHLPVKIGAIGVNSIAIALDNIIKLEWKEACLLERFNDTSRILVYDDGGKGVWIDHRGFDGF